MTTACCRGAAARCKRGLASGVMTTIGGLGHALPYLIPDFWTATTIAMIVVFVELWAIAWIQNRYHGNPVPAGGLAGRAGRCSGLCRRRADRGRADVSQG